MRHSFIGLFTAGCTVALLWGCGPQAAPPPPSPSPATQPAQAQKPAAQAPAPASGNAVVDVLTQRSAVNAGQRAKETINKVKANEQKDLDEVTGK